MFRLIRTMLARSTPRSAAPNRRLTRVEILESRAMLSTAFISADTLHFGRSEFNSGIILNGMNGGGGTFGMPPSDFDNNGKRPSESPPANSLPPVPRESLPPLTLPEAPKTQDPPPPPQEDDPSPPVDDGGFNDLGGPKGTGEADISPPDVAAERETRAVLQMLSKLQYSLETRGSDSLLDASPAEGDFAGFLHDLADVTAERDDDAEREGGAVAIAIQEVVAERDADAEWNDTLEALHDISVEMDSTSGRYQAFEVSTLEEGSIPIAAHNASAVNAASESDVVDGAAATDTAESVSPAEETSPEPAASAGVPLSLVTPPMADESSQVTWTSVVALVTLGIVLQFCREWKISRLRTHAAFAWQHLVESPGWFGRRSKMLKDLR